MGVGWFGVGRVWVCSFFACVDDEVAGRFWSWLGEAVFAVEMNEDGRSQGRVDGIFGGMTTACHGGASATEGKPPGQRKRNGIFFFLHVPQAGRAGQTDWRRDGKSDRRLWEEGKGTKRGDFSHARTSGQAFCCVFASLNVLYLGRDACSFVFYISSRP